LKIHALAAFDQGLRLTMDGGYGAQGLLPGMVDEAQLLQCDDSPPLINGDSSGHEIALTYHLLQCLLRVIVQRGILTMDCFRAL